MNQMNTTNTVMGDSQQVSKSGEGRHVVTAELVTAAVCIALTFVFTAFVNVRLPIPAVGGLVHLGNIPLFLTAVLFGKKQGALAGGIGMAVFDLLSGWTLYAPCTLIVCGLMGFVVGEITEKKKSMGFMILAFLAALAIKIAGYYIYEAVIYHSLMVPAASIPGNMTQVILAAIIVLIIVKPISKAVKMLHL